MMAVKRSAVARALVAVVTSIAVYALCVAVVGSPLGTPGWIVAGVLGGFSGNLLHNSKGGRMDPAIEKRIMEQGG